MSNPKVNPESASRSFRGSMKAGSFTAQLGVELTATAEAITLSTFGRTYQVDREHFGGFELTSVLGIFKRGVRIRHSQQSLPSNIVFYPSIGQENFTRELASLGWC